MPDPDNIVPFPETMMLQWQPYDRILRAQFNASGTHSPAAVEDMLNRLRPLFLTHARSASAHMLASSDYEDPLHEIQDWVARVTVGLLGEIANREDQLMALGQA